MVIIYQNKLLWWDTMMNQYLSWVGDILIEHFMFSASASTSASASASASAAYLLPDEAGRQVSWVGPVSPEKKNFQSNMWPLKEIKHKKAKSILAKYLSASQLTCSSHYCAAAPPMYHCSILRLPEGNRKRISYEKCTTILFVPKLWTTNVSGDLPWCVVQLLLNSLVERASLLVTTLASLE